MAFMRNLGAFQDVQDRIDANENRLKQAKRTIDDAVADLQRIESDLAAPLTTVAADIAASQASSDPVQQQLALVTLAAKTSVFADRDALLTKAQAQQAALAPLQ